MARLLQASEYIQCASSRGIDRKPPLESLPIPTLLSSGQWVLSDHCRRRRSLRPQKPHSVPKGKRNELVLEGGTDLPKSRASQQPGHLVGEGDQYRTRSCCGYGERTRIEINIRTRWLLSGISSLFTPPRIQMLRPPSCKRKLSKAMALLPFLAWASILLIPALKVMGWTRIS
jgi:hypothetical protein